MYQALTFVICSSILPVGSGFDLCLGMAYVAGSGISLPLYITALGLHHTPLIRIKYENFERLYQI